MPILSPQSAIIVGAGPVGLCCALALAQAGHSVTVINSGARGAGWASGGMLGAVYETLERDDVPSALTQMAFESLALWSDLATRIGIAIHKNSVFIGRTASEVGFLSGLANNPNAALSGIDVPVGLVGMAAWQCAHDLAIDPRAALHKLRLACLFAGIGFVEGSVVECTKGQVTLANSSVHKAQLIILATGQGGDGLRDCVPELANITTVKGQLLALASGVPKSVIRAGRLYLIPRGGHVVIGATSSAQDVDVAVIEPKAHTALHQEAIALCPQLRDAPIVESWAGLRPMTRDTLPMIGRSSVEGVLLACGTYRNGWLLAPAIAKALVECIALNEQIDTKLQCFSPQRFPI